MKRLIDSFRYAIKGIIYALKHERNFQIEIFISILVVFLSFLFSISTMEWLVILILIVLVLALELVNTAAEYMLDHFHPQHSKWIAHTKDIFAGAVLICAVISMICGLLIFLPKIWGIISK